MYFSFNAFPNKAIVRVDISTGQPVLEDIQIPETPEQQRIRELEDELLLQAENEVGGIL